MLSVSSRFMNMHEHAWFCFCWNGPFVPLSWLHPSTPISVWRRGTATNNGAKAVTWQQFTSMLRMFQMFQPLFVHGILWLRFVRLRESRHADLSPGRGPGVKHDFMLGFFWNPKSHRDGEFTVQICTNFACHPLCRRWHSHRDSHDSQWFLGQRNDRPFATLGYTLDLWTSFLQLSVNLLNWPLRLSSSLQDVYNIFATLALRPWSGGPTTRSLEPWRQG